ncbi:hypothetical protein [Bifidobacterium sp.]|jgi:hypothetical protein|uniref:hypothetical protein n=1 Tax=Bifidobacterium sp. TaxID=41200 RepID=UPI0025B8734E|nr:hypothetical protein [Bifidobacterium sp.]MCH4209764.1 hypothetical protein [Bifidobacterium sp.]MCI1224926.1 hypothetical protein [Bifidobacterium sp.]
MAFNAEPNRTQTDPSAQKPSVRPSAQPSPAMMFAAQLIATFVFAACCVVGAVWGLPEIVVAVLAAVALLTFVALWPLRADMIARIAALVAGAASILVAMLPGVAHQDGTFIEPSALMAHAMMPVVSRWASALVVLLILLVITGFLRQMLREPRTELVRSLSSFVLGGVAAVGSAGWIILARVLRQWHDLVAPQPSGAMRALSTGSAWILCAVALAALAVIVAMAFVSRQWWQDAAIDALNPAPWLGFGLLPAMVHGFLAFLVAFAALAL